MSIKPSQGARGEEILDGEGGGGEEKGFSPSALSLFRFHLSPFHLETPYTRGIVYVTL